jgi:hypothetical protein
MTRRLTAFVVMALWLVAMVPAAQADTGDIIEPQHDPPTAKDGWQAGVCTTDTPPCSPETPENFFLEAGGHPPIGFTQYFLRHTEGTGTVEPAGIPVPIMPLVGQGPAGPVPERTIRTLRADLPPGLSVNPEATPRCPRAKFEKLPIPECPANTIIGREEVTLVVNTPGVVPAPSPPFPAGNTLPVGFVIPPSEASGTKVPVYNVEPRPGEPASFGFVIAGSKIVYLETEVAWESDYHQSFTIRPPAPSAPFSTLKSRLVSFGQAGDGTFISNPTTCFDPAQWPTLYSTWFRAESYGEPPNPAFPNGLTPFEAKVEDDEGNLYQQKGCAEIPFKPDIGVSPGTGLIDSPAPAAVATVVPFEVPTAGGDPRSQSHVRRAEVTLPADMGLNPSGSNGLVACTDAQFKKGQRVAANECPAASRIGTVEVEAPPLPPGALKGELYVGEQKSSDPESGEQFRILAEAKSDQYGVVARLIGHTVANRTTGQLTTVFDDQLVGPLAGVLPRGLPQVPFESVTLRFDGSKSILTSPGTCATAESTGRMEPWARPDEQVPVSSKFTLSADPAGGTCPTTLAARRFTPTYTAKSDNAKSKIYSPFRVHIGRNDGEQEIKGIDVTLPQGLTGKLKGVPYCSANAIAAAIAGTGLSQRADPACPKSQIGTTSTDAGTGPNPLKISGKAYLAGPYKGAPLSMVVITPGVAGPFDLGNVVVRVALFVNPKTAQVKAVADPIPHVFGGVKLDLRSIDVDVDRKKFMKNPTNCRAGAVSGVINGGGANPAEPAAFSSYPVSAPYRASKCKRLGFKPKLSTRLLGGKGTTQRAKHPALRAILTTRENDANIRRAALALPHALFLDQGNIGTVCTKPQLASRTCPKRAKYGNAKAITPLLDKPLKGPVYLVSSSNELPDLVADLRGQVNIQLHGVIDSVRGGIKTTFKATPDVPVDKFVLRMQGGRKKGLLVNSRNLCQGPLDSVLNLKAQNGKRLRDKSLPLKVSGC